MLLFARAAPVVSFLALLIFRAPFSATVVNTLSWHNVILTQTHEKVDTGMHGLRSLASTLRLVVT